MTNEERVYLIQSGIEPTKNLEKLYMDNLKLITKFVALYSNKADIEDLKQEAYFGLLKAVENYDHLQGVKFMTYAEHWIKQVAHRYMFDNFQSVRIPAHLVEKIQKYKRACRNFVSKYERDPQDVEMAHILVCKVEDIRKYKQLIRPEMRLDEPLSEEAGTRVDFISDQSGEEGFEEVENNYSIVKGVVNELPENYKKVIYLRYWHNMTYSKIAEYTGYGGKVNVRGIEHKALRKLRRNKVILALGRELDYIHDYKPRNVYHGTYNSWRYAQGSSVELAVEQELSREQELFCKYYAETFQAAESYQKVFGGSYDEALNKSKTLFNNSQIVNEIIANMEAVSS